MSYFDDHVEEIIYGAPLKKYSRVTVMPARHGAEWTSEEDHALLSRANLGIPVTDIAKIHKRTQNSISMRLDWLAVNRRNPKPLKKESNIVNLNHLITLLQKDYTTCEVMFRDSAKYYTYKIHNKFLPGLVEKESLLVVPARDDFAVVKLMALHKEPQIDPALPYELKWVVSVLDLTQWKEQEQREKEALEMIKVAERRKAQEEALSVLLGHVNREELIKLINGELT